MAVVSSAQAATPLTPPVQPATTSTRALAAPGTPAAARLVPPPTTSALPRPPAAQGGSPPAPAATRPLVATGGGFAVHLASLRDPAGAAEEWRRLRRLHPTLLQGVELRPPRPVEVPGQGTYYRVAGGAFATRAEAQAACARLRAAGQYCTVVAAAP